MAVRFALALGVSVDDVLEPEGWQQEVYEKAQPQDRPPHGRDREAAAAPSGFRADGNRFAAERRNAMTTTEELEDYLD